MVTGESEVTLLQKRVAELERELALLRDTPNSLLIHEDAAVTLGRIVELCRKALPADAYGIWRKRVEDGYWIIAAQEGLSDSFVQSTPLNAADHPPLPSQPIALEDVDHAPLVAARLSELQAEGIRSLLLIPIRIRNDGEGSLVCYWRAPRQFSESEIRVAVALGNVIASGLANSDTLQQHVRELDIVADALPALISFVDTELRYVRVNKAYEQMFGRGQDEIVGKSVEEVIGPKAFETAKPNLERALKGERTSIRTFLTRHDGSRRHIDATFTPEFAFDHSVRGVIVMAHDTTERNRDEEARARLAAIVDSSDDAIISKTLRGIITTWNSGAERMFGFAAEEVLGKHITVVIPEERWPEEEQVLARLGHGERIDHFETVRRTKDGRDLQVSLSVSPVKDDTGQIIGASKTARDITNQKLLLQREQRARETAELLNRVGPTVSGELNPQVLTQKVTDLATQAVHAEFGALFHNVLNEKGESYVLYTLSGVPREAFEKFPMPRNTHVFGPTFRGDGPVRSDDITKDPRYGQNPPYHGMPQGHLPVCSYLAVPVVSRTGEVLGGLFFGHKQPGVFTLQDEQIAVGIAAQAAVALDVASLFTESQRTQFALSRSNEQLRRANDDLNQFANSASHDLQEPLRTISIYSQLLRRKLAGALDAEGEEFFGHVLRSASRMEALIRDLLAYSQASVMSDEEPLAADADIALDSALSNLNAAIASAEATIVRSDLPAVRIREIHLAQVFQNLIGNAIKYRKQEPPRIEIRAVRQDNEWLFSIADNGIGIDEKYKEQIFGIFKRLHTAYEYSGTGIGLAICQRIVERARGRIWVESEPGRGSTFYFTVPAGE